MAQSNRIFGTFLIVLKYILYVSAFTLPESTFEVAPANIGPLKPSASLSDLLAPIDDIEDMEKIFENYERQYSNNDNLAADDQLLIEPSLDDARSRHIISSRASDPDAPFDASGNGQAIVITDEVSESIATVRNLIEELDEQQHQQIVKHPTNSSSERENRTIIVVVTTNIINRSDKEDEEPNRAQHNQLSFGLQQLLPFLPTAAPQPQLDLHNRITTEFFNAGFVDNKAISTDGVDRSGDLDSVTEMYENPMEVSTNVIIEMVSSAEPLEFSTNQSIIENSTLLSANSSPLEDTHSGDYGSNDNNFNVNTNDDDRIPDIIDSIPHEELREKYIQDIPKNEHIPMVSKVENPLGIHIPADNRRIDDISEYVVEDLPIDEDAGREAEAIIIDVDNVVPDRCKVLVNGVVYGTKQCFNDTDKIALSRISRQLEDSRDEVLDPSQNDYNFGESRQMMPRIYGEGANNHYEDMRFMDFLHTYLLQYMGRSYLESGHMRLRFDRLVTKKHILENIRAGSIRDMSDYIEKTTYFNFPNHSSCIPEYLLSGDREKDQQKLDRLLYNRRYSVELWKRVLKEDENEMDSKSSVDLSAISIEQLRNNKTDFIVELSDVKDEQKEIMLVRNKAGTAEEDDVLTFVGDKHVWANGDDKVPWFRMSEEERRDVEFAAYMHALIDTRREILPRTAYYINLENPSTNIRRRSQQAANSSVPNEDRESRSLRNDPSSTYEGTVIDNILSDGSPAAVLMTKSHLSDGVQFVEQKVIVIPDETEQFSIDKVEHTHLEQIVRTNDAFFPEPIEVEKLAEIKYKTTDTAEVLYSTVRTLEKYLNVADDNIEEVETIQNSDIASINDINSAKDQVSTVRTIGKSLNADIDGIISQTDEYEKIPYESKNFDSSPFDVVSSTSVNNLITSSTMSSPIVLDSPSPTISTILDVNSETILQILSDKDDKITFPDIENIENIENTQLLEVLINKHAPQDLSTYIEVVNATDELKVPEVDIMEEEPLEIVPISTPTLEKQLELLTGEFLVVANQSIEESYDLKTSILPIVLSTTVTPDLIDNIEGSGIGNPIIDSNLPQDILLPPPTIPIINPETNDIITSHKIIKKNGTMVLEPTGLITSHKIIKKNGTMELDNSSEESKEISRTIDARVDDDDDDDDDDDPKSTRATDLLRSVVEAVELTNDLSRTMDNFRSSLLEDGAIRQTRSETSVSSNSLPISNEMDRLVDEQRNEKLNLARSFNFAEAAEYSGIFGLIVTALFLVIAVVFFALRSCDRYELVILATDGNV